MTQREQLLRELSQTEEERWASLTAGAGEDESFEGPAERLHAAKEKAAATKEKQKRAQQKQKAPAADATSQSSQVAVPAGPSGPRQRTLFERSRAQGGAASQHMDVDALMKKFTQQEEEAESKIDISRFLKDDDEDEGFGGALAADDDPAFSAEGFLSALLSTGPSAVAANATVATSETTTAAAGGGPTARIGAKGGLFDETVGDNEDDARLVVPLSDDAAMQPLPGDGSRKSGVSGGAKQFAAQSRGAPAPAFVKSEGATAKQTFVKKELAAAPQSIVSTGTSSTQGATSSSSAPTLEANVAAVKTERDDESVQPPSDAAVYWLDAKEQDHTYAVDPGSLFLFGKCVLAAVPGGGGGNDGSSTQTESCCLRIRNVQRCVMILPKDGCEVDDAVKEVAQYCAKCGIRSFRLKVVSRHYAFEEPNIPRAKRTWIKLKFPGSMPPLPPRSSWETVEAVVGSNRSLLELFLLKRRFRGPSYLKIAEWAPVPPEQRISFCRHEFLVLDPKHVTPLDGGVPPPLVVMSLNLHTQLDASNAHNEIHAVSLVVSRSISMEGSARSCTIASQIVGVRPFDAATPLPVDLEKQCSNRGLRSVRRFANEQQLLQWTASTIREVDPDVLVGHNFHSFTLDVLLHRYQTLKVHAWSSLGKLDLRQMPKLQQGAGGTNESTFQEREVCTGRLVADTYLLAREYHRSSNYKLLVLAQQLGLSGIFGPVDDSQVDAAVPVLSRESMSSSAAVFDVLARCLNLCVLSLTLANQLDVIPLTKRLTTLAGNLWSRTLFGSRAERIEYLLLHAFHELKFVTPDKKSYEAIQKMKRTHDDADDDVGGGAGGDDATGASSGRRGGNKSAKYKGGMVLDPKSGLYTDYVLLLDFNSLYPSLIQEFYICFTTVRRAGGGTVFEEGENPDDPSEVPPPEALLCTECRAAGAPAPCTHKCILPKVIKGLVDSRREVRRLMKSERNPALFSQLDIRQKALKLTANSMYGCLGFEYSRFYAQPLAELVTRQGRQALLRTVEMVPLVHPALHVLYGDTDSVMIQTGVKNDLRLVRDMANDIKAKVNKAYRCLEIDIDGIFRSILLHKKKKYAAVHVVDWAGEGKILKKEVKGLDMVRRDWCPLSHRCCDDILNRILDTSSTAEGTDDLLEFLCQYMGRVADDVRAGNVYPLEDFVVSKSLTKEPETYKGTSFPHATVALRMRERKEQVRVGDLIPYVVCVPLESTPGASSHAPLSVKAFHPDEVRAKPELALDVEWYLNTQLFPPVLRICEHIQGFSAAQLGEAMHIHVAVDEGRDETAGDAVDTQRAQEALDFSSMFRSLVLEECFPTAVPLEVACTKCQIMTPIRPHDRVQSVVESWATQPHLADKPFPLYQCHACHHTISPVYVSNCLYMAARRHIVTFYRSGGTPAALRLLRQQMTYYRAAFDVPHTPGYSRRLIAAHERLALRCVINNDPTRATKLLTLHHKKVLEKRQQDDKEKQREASRSPSASRGKTAVDAPATDADVSESELWDVLDPVQYMLKALYDRMEHMFFHDIQDLLGSLPAKRIKVDL